ncbi:MAG: hypothetical protein AB1Z21_02405 [Synechococcaceae cyanobacterium]
MLKFSKACSHLSSRLAFPWLALAFAALAVFIVEPGTTNLFREGHFNWVSHHSLAIAMHSTLKTGLVGYSCKLFVGGGDFFYDYFNRYPFAFAFISRSILKWFASDVELLLYVSRQLMNVLFLANILVLVLVGQVLGFGAWLSIFSALLLGASRSWLYYKSMYHFDQPALLALSLIILLVAFIWKNPGFFGSTRLAVLMVGSAAAVASGRSGSILIFLMACLVIYRLQPAAFWPGAGKEILLSLLFSLFTLFAFTGYAILLEARINDVALTDTSVVQSAMRRLGVSVSGFTDGNIRTISWSRAIPRLFSFVARYCSPGAAILFVIAGYLQFRDRSPSGVRHHLSMPALESFQARLVSPVFAINLACFVTGIGWCLGMKNLVVFHDYAAMYIVPFFYLSTLVAGARVLPFVEPIKTQMLGFALLVFVASLFAVQAYFDVRPQSGEAYQAIRRFYLDLNSFRSGQPDGKDPALMPVLRDEDWIPGSPYAQCLFLNNPLVSAGDFSRMAVEGVAPHLLDPPRLEVVK